jgi:hypothetical protein
MTLNIPPSHPELADHYESVRLAMEKDGASRGISVGTALRFSRGIHPLTGDRWVYTATDARGRSIFGSLIHGPRD